MSNVDEQALSAKLLISPLVGEMSGRTEGGAKDRYISIYPEPLHSSADLRGLVYNSNMWLESDCNPLGYASYWSTRSRC